MTNSTPLRSVVLFTMLCAGAAGCRVSEAAPAGEFAKHTVDIGIVVRDIDAAAKFYTEAIGFRETGGFHVPSSLGGGAGLSEDKPFDVRVFQLGEGAIATKIKLMQFTGVSPTPIDQAFIHSSYGFRYVTVSVKDMGAALARLARASVKPLAEGPVELPKELATGVYLTVVRDPDGNFVELVGPRS